MEEDAITDENKDSKQRDKETSRQHKTSHDIEGGAYTMKEEEKRREEKNLSAYTTGRNNSRQVLHRRGPATGWHEAVEWPGGGVAGGSRVGGGH